MVEADDRAQAPDFPARQTLDAQTARAYHDEAMSDMFDLLDDDVEAVASDLFEPDERMLALFAGHPTKPRHFLACSERSVVLFKRDRDGALSMRIIPLSQIEAIDLRPLTEARTGAVVLRTVSTSAGPAFTFPLETHFAYYRMVALTRLMRRLQAGEQFDVALTRLKLEAYAARELFVGDGQQGPPMPEPSSDTPPRGGRSAQVPGDGEWGAQLSDEVGFDSLAGDEIPDTVAAAAAAAANEEPDEVEPPPATPAEEATSPTTEQAADKEERADDDTAAAPPPPELPPHSADDDAPPPPPPPDAPSENGHAKDPGSVDAQVADADSTDADAAPDAEATQPEPLAAPAETASEAKSEEPPEPAAAASEPEAEEPPPVKDAEPVSDEADAFSNVLASAGTPFRAPVKAVSDVNLPALSDKQMRARLKMKEMAAAEERQAGESSHSRAPEAKPTTATSASRTTPNEPGASAKELASGSEDDDKEEDQAGRASNLVSDVALDTHEARSKSRATSRKRASSPSPSSSEGSQNGNDNSAGEAQASTSQPPSSRSESGSATSELRKSQVRGKRPAVAGDAATKGSETSSSSAVRRSQSTRRTQRSEPRDKTSRTSTGSGGGTADAKPFDPALKRESWFLYRGAAQHGPYPYEQLREWFRAGKLGASEFVRSRSMSQWIRVHQVFEA